MKQTRRSFLKFLGKASVVAAGIAVAPKTVLGFKPQDDKNAGLFKASEILDKHEREEWDGLYGRGPVTATEIIDRREEFLQSANEALNEAFLKQYEKNVMEVFRQTSSVLRIKK